MADRIRLLPEVVANQIAAGEVVNRPASVVKEMMENAIDAGARCVKVNFRDGGRELIQIVDDGCGMSPIDARMAFDRHATSKIRSVEDIYDLHTFGFRGEALASIAAVAQVELRTRQADDEMGTVTEINGGQFVSQSPVMCPAGSQFFVRNLFYNVPARRRFLEKSTTSASQIRSEFQRVALCNPQIAFELYANDAPVYTLAATSLAGRIVDVVGRHIKQNLLEVEADTSIARITGYIGRPAAAKRRNADQYLFVNGRYFKSAYLTSAVMKAYEKLIPESAQPAYFLYLTIDPSRIDVNVHPQKTEVKFADEEAVWQIVHAAMRETLARTGAVPMMDFDRDNTVEIPVMQRGAVYSEPLATSNRDYNPFREEYIDPTAPDPNVDFTGFDVPYSDDAQRVSDAAAGGSRVGSGTAAVRRPVQGGIRPDGGFRLPDLPGEEFEEFASGSDSGLVEIPAAGADGAGLPGGEFGESTLDFIPSESDAGQQRLDVEPRAEFTDLLPLGGGYVAALFDGRFVVVDVRRARERVLYEEYLQMLGHGEAVSEQLLFPERLVLSGEEYALMEENAVEFAALGFDIDLCGGGAVEVKGTPADLPADSVDTTLYELLQAFATPVSLHDVRRERIAAAMARSAVRGPQRMLSREEAAALLARLAAGGNISFSPSGKAILTEITAEELRGRLG
ncbi:DNA mismatch repair endonuclease MutL [uncultured Alistipes sp.]|uniref:DNA mismatch repair endonuclease MutL n=1 Tax=uncultured Alistipes sp. TaxID=538949 RepID=UPI002603620B|nr:DNA mismatch repair endonuclease MutL [uncultured Alistipes sp.]